MSLFRRGPDRTEVEGALENARGLIEILKLSRANVDAAEVVLQEASAFLERNELARAMATIERAERIATSLEADYRAATEARTKVEANAERLRALGAPTAEERAGLEAIHARASSKRELAGAQVPDYEGARGLAEEALRASNAKVGLAEAASDQIFAAELTVDQSVESFPIGIVDALIEARRVLDRARAELGSGAFDLAATDASRAEKIALDVLEQRRHAEETLASAEKLLAGLKGIGINVVPVARSLEMGKTLLAKGKLVAAKEVFDDAAQEGVALGTAYRTLLDAMTDAQRAIEEVRREGLPSEEAESALSRAKTAMKAGNYHLAASCAEDVQFAVRRAREQREGLRTWLEESKVQVVRLKEMGLAFVNDVEEMVEKADREFVSGDYAGTTEDLRIAALLMKPALNGKVRDGPEIAR